MRIIEPSVELINAPDYKTLLTTIEAAGRTCYKSEDKITDDSAERFVRGIIMRGHEAVIEHGSLTVRFICDRGVSHEIVWRRSVRNPLGTAITARRASAVKSPLFAPLRLIKKILHTGFGNEHVSKRRLPTLICWTRVVPLRKLDLSFRTA